MNIGSMFLRKKSTSAGPGKADAGAACGRPDAAGVEALRPTATRQTAVAIVTQPVHPRRGRMTRLSNAMTLLPLLRDVGPAGIHAVGRQDRSADPGGPRARLDLGHDLTRLEVDRERVVRPRDGDVH